MAKALNTLVDDRPLPRDGEGRGGGARRLPRRPTASQMLYDSLRDRVLSLELAPGAPLSRAEIAETYGVSQTPVRDALQRLEAEGLVETFPQSRTLVAKIDLAHARETQFLRLGLELEVARVLAAAPDPAAAASSSGRARRWRPRIWRGSRRSTAPSTGRCARPPATRRCGT